MDTTVLTDQNTIQLARVRGLWELISSDEFVEGYSLDNNIFNMRRAEARGGGGGRRVSLSAIRNFHDDLAESGVTTYTTSATALTGSSVTRESTFPTMREIDEAVNGGAESMRSFNNRYSTRTGGLQGSVPDLIIMDEVDEAVDSLSTDRIAHSYDKITIAQQVEILNLSFRKGGIITKVWCNDCVRTYSLHENRSCPGCESDIFRIREDLESDKFRIIKEEASYPTVEPI